MKVLLWLSGGLDRRTPSEHLVKAIVEALYHEGHTVHIIQKDTAGSLPPLPQKLQELGVTTDCVPSMEHKKSNFFARYLADIKYVADCAKLLRNDCGYGAVFLQSSNIAGIALWLLRRKLGKQIPITYNVQDIFPYNAVYSGHLSKNGLPFRVLAAIQRYAYRKADRMVTISEDMRELLIEAGAAPETVESIYNWSYRDEPYVAEEMDCTVARSMFPETHFNVVYAGNIGVMQNVDLLVETAKLMQDEKDICFHIVGDGAYKEKLQGQAAELQNVRFHPMQSSDLAPSLYITADVNVIPLVKNVYRTALPSKTATCLACGNPIILAIGKESRFGQKVAAEGGCIQTDSDSPEQLRDALLQLKNSKSMQNGMRFFKQNCSITRNSRRYAEIITETTK